MINRIYSLPDNTKPSAEIIKIQNLFDTYPDISQLFMQKETGSLLFLLDGDMIIHGDIEAEETKKFLSFLKPQSVFSSSYNLKRLFGEFEEVNVLIKEKPTANIVSTAFSDELSSREIYDILSVSDFDLPDYEHFATDYCRRLNHGQMQVFAKKDRCAAITLETENYRMLSGIVSRQKGLGGALLAAAISGNKPVIAVCRDELLPFYLKYGFKPLYKAGYWRK